MRTLTHKGYGRIYCEAAKVQEVEALIGQLDSFEFTYMPKGIVAPFTEYPNVVYTHKFSDMDMDMLTASCWARGIYVWVFDAGREEYPKDATVKP